MLTKIKNDIIEIYRKFSVNKCMRKKILHDLGNAVTFLPINRGRMNKYTANLQRIGIECIYGPYCKSVEEFLKEKGNMFDTIIINGYTVCDKYFETIKRPF